MKVVVNLVRIIVGVLFIFSGLVKAIDPLGLSYKMQEFFELWHMTQFNSWTLLLSILMNAFEIIAGFALLLGWRIRLFMWLLLLLVLFFTFLTGYAYLSGKFKNCGCFGDCLPISPLTSFLKDIILTILIGFLFWQRNKITPLFNEKTNTWTMFVVTLLSFGLQWYSLTYLPPVDCLPYKKGNNISEQMKMPANAVPDVFETRIIYKKINSGEVKDMSQEEFYKSNIWEDSTWKQDTMITTLVKKGKNNEPPIKGFVLTSATGADSTEAILSMPYAILVYLENFEVSVSKWKKDFEKLHAAAQAKRVPVFIVTGRREEAAQKFSGTVLASIPVLTSDFTAIRTAARTSPCVYLLNKGTIVEKQSYKNFDKVSGRLKAMKIEN
jgi:uncharacterized membrane protein YphA (DoxX/SURF4 family)